MSEYSYIAISSTGERVPGVLTAASRGEALHAISLRSLVPISLTESRTRSTRTGRVKPAAIAAMFTLLADQLETGVPLLKALQVLQQQTTHEVLRQTLSAVAADVADGASLADAIAKHNNVFSELDISIVQAGEEGGFLDESLQRLAAVRERQEDVRHKLISALAYPALLSVVGTLVVAGMLTFFVPKFEPLFENLRHTGRMPWATTLLLAVSGWLKSWGLLALAAVIGSLLLVKTVVPVRKLRSIYDRSLLRIAAIGPVLRSFAIARFCRILGTLLQNDVPMLTSLEISRKATGNQVLSQTIAEAAVNIGSGRSLAVPLAASGQFPPDVIEMLSVAEQSNHLEPVLLKLADKLEARSQQKLDLLMRLLEPAMMLIMALIVGFLVIALLMPVFEGNGMT